MRACAPSIAHSTLLHVRELVATATSSALDKLTRAFAVSADEKASGWSGDEATAGHDRESPRVAAVLVRRPVPFILCEHS